MRAATLFATACAIFLVAPGALADAGRPEDAPGDWVDAWDVPMGVLNGTLGGVDRGDWYRVDGSGDEWLVVRAFVPVSGLTLQVRADNGTFLSERALPKGNTTAVWTPGQVARIGIAAPENATTNGTGATETNYSLDVRGFTSTPPPPPPPREEVADFAVTGLWVENVPDLPPGRLTTDMGPPSLGTRRLIHIEIENRGMAEGNGSVRVHIQGQVGNVGTGRSFGVGYHWLAPGESRAIAVLWNATGSVGDVSISANVTVKHDPDPANDGRTVHHYVMIGGSGLGVVNSLGVCTLGVCASPADGQASTDHSLGVAVVTTNATLAPRTSAGVCVQGRADACAWAGA